MGRMIIYRRRVFLEYIIILSPRRELEFVNSFRIKQMVLPITPPLVLAPGIQGQTVHLPVRKRVAVSLPYFFGERLKPHTFDAGRRPGKIFIHLITEC